MKCLSVRQPWAEMIARGQKTVELRSWTTAYRGPVIILAGARRETRWNAPALDAPTGVAVAAVTLLDVHAIDKESFARSCVSAPMRDFRGWFAWELRMLRRLPSKRVSGALGLYAPDSELMQLLGLS